jgi:hypothetical protein
MVASRRFDFWHSEVWKENFKILALRINAIYALGGVFDVWNEDPYFVDIETDV